MKVFFYTILIIASYFLAYIRFTMDTTLNFYVNMFGWLMLGCLILLLIREMLPIDRETKKHMRAERKKMKELKVIEKKLNKHLIEMQKGTERLEKLL